MNAIAISHWGYVPLSNTNRAINLLFGADGRLLGVFQHGEFASMGWHPIPSIYVDRRPPPIKLRHVSCDCS